MSLSVGGGGQLLHSFPCMDPGTNCALCTCSVGLWTKIQDAAALGTFESLGVLASSGGSRLEPSLCGVRFKAPHRGQPFEGQRVLWYLFRGGSEATAVDRHLSTSN